MSEPQESIRELSKWLNEEPNRPVDRVALATVLHRVEELQKREAMMVYALEKAKNGIVWYSENSDDADDSDTEMLCEIDAALSATSAETEAWLQAEIVKRLGKPFGYLKLEFGRMPDFHYKEKSHEGMMPVYSLPSPLTTAEERKDEHA